MKNTNYEKQIAAVIKDAAKQPGFVAELTRQFKKVAGQEIQRQAVDRWLNPDKDKRIVPNANTAEHLLAAAELTRKVFDANRD